MTVTTAVPAGDYVYVSALPEGRCGHRYRVHRTLLALPTLQEQVLVECLTGPDAGLWFTVTPANFRTRYVPETEASRLLRRPGGAWGCPTG